jgi:hypothetical protein
MIIIGITVTALALNGHSTVSHDIRVSEAQNIAEAGADDAIAVTLANYDDIYPGGSYPSADHPGDGVQFYEQAQPLTDAQGNEVGTYQVWTKEDPERPGNILITSIGTMGGDNPQTSTVRVSVQYTARIFDYALLVGDPDAPYYGDGDSHSHASCTPALEMKTEDGGSIDVTGNVHVNGCMYVDSDNGSHGDPGVITFNSRDGYNDTVTYLDSFDGTVMGNQPTQTDTPVEFPTVDFDMFTNVITVNLPDSGTPSGIGWSRHDEEFTISAADFQTNYGSYDAVKFTAADNSEYKIKITGSGDMDNPDVITSSILVPGSGGSDPAIKKLEFENAGVSLQPGNGIAIVSAEGKVELEDGVIVGAPGAGALIYATGQSHESEFEMKEGAIVYGSVVVSSPEVELKAEGGDGDHHEDHGHPLDGNINIFYDGAYLSEMPSGWWSGGSLTAVKENFERG